eukprot:GFYU01000377.1.p1 GENE.GFYU01000377.1~~GFYU01000377.1.p1  ORF type:complete len:376 (-),score=75.17 GFYU01000377.1:81-1208(-)
MSRKIQQSVGEAQLNKLANATSGRLTRSRSGQIIQQIVERTRSGQGGAPGAHNIQIRNEAATSIHDGDNFDDFLNHLNFILPTEQDSFDDFAASLQATGGLPRAASGMLGRAPSGRLGRAPSGNLGRANSKAGGNQLPPSSNGRGAPAPEMVAVPPPAAPAPVPAPTSKRKRKDDGGGAPTTKRGRAAAAAAQPPPAAQAAALPVMVGASTVSAAGITTPDMPLGQVPKTGTIMSSTHGISVDAQGRITYDPDSTVFKEEEDGAGGGDGFTISEDGVKRAIRLMKNRESAARSRQRKKVYTEALEHTVSNLSVENAELKAAVQALSSENKLLKTVTELKMENSSLKPADKKDAKTKDGATNAKSNQLRRTRSAKM